jgi:3-oxoacyl-[acyl-carrier-protein] synthase-3
MTDIQKHISRRLGEVRANLRLDPLPNNPNTRFADALDSMGLVELVGVLADDCGVSPEEVERAAGRRFGTVAELAAALTAAGLSPASTPSAGRTPPPAAQRPLGWLSAVSAALPPARQLSAEVDVLLGRPAGWLLEHAGISTRCQWGDTDPLEAAARAACACLEEGILPPEAVGALLVTAEAPPALAGLAAHLHHRLGLSSAVPLEMGGACTGFLTALWTATRLLPAAGHVLLVAVEAHSRWLMVRPGPAGEAAALFGDGAAACVLSAEPLGKDSLPLVDVVVRAQGDKDHLLRVRHVSDGAELEMKGTALAGVAVRAMAGAVEDVVRRHGLTPADLTAVVVHGGNGRMPALVARVLGIPPERVASRTAETGNLGSASLPVAHAALAPARGPLVWAAVGAGLLWGAALFGAGAGVS